jgi:hypothetical protein
MLFGAVAIEAIDREITARLGVLGNGISMH